MYSASLIAALFVTKGIAEANPITQMQLQKMVFFAQGVNLAKTEKPLIKEVFEAWKFGPVVPIIYENYKLYGSSPITNTQNVYNFPTEQIKGNILNSDGLQAINYTWKATSHLTAYQLSNWTHKLGSPWQAVYNQYDRSLPISNDLIKDYFVEFLRQ